MAIESFWVPKTIPLGFKYICTIDHKNEQIDEFVKKNFKIMNF